MKVIKNILLGALVVISGVVIATERAEAGCGYGVRADWRGGEYGFYAPCDRGESEDGAIGVKTEIVDGVVGVLRITLKNYNGGKIYWECCATCDGVEWKKVVFELHGNSTITEENGIGINFKNVEFVGDGNLTIRAMIPVAGGGYDGSVYACTGVQSSLQIQGVDMEALSKTLGTTVMKVAAGEAVEVAENEQGVQDAVTEKPEAIKEKEGDSGLVWHILSGVYIGLSLLVFVILGIGAVMRKNGSVKNNAIQEGLVNMGKEDENGQ